MPKIINFTNEEINKIIELYRGGLSLVQVGNNFSVTKPVIKRILKENSIKTRTSGETLTGKVSKLLGIPKSQDHKDNLSIAKKHKLSDGTFYPKIPITCQCKDILCNEICWNGAEFKVGHHFRGQEKSEE